MSSVVISKSPPVVVKPSEEKLMETCDINLSYYDKWGVASAPTAFLVFEHAIQEPVETIRSGLSQALVHYYPIAGRLAVGATAGEVVIKCTQEGVPFVAASANCAIKDVRDLADPSLQEELAVFYPPPGGMSMFSEPLLLMQVTVFSCGGFVLGVTWNHSVADGIGMGQFLQAVGELSRGLPSPSVVPFRQEDSIILGPPPAFIYFFYSFLASIQPSLMAVRDITVKASLVNHIKDMYASINAGRTCTVFEVVAAVLWRCRTRAIMSKSDPEALTAITFVSNARKYAGAKEGYYGNCGLAHLVTASNGVVANSDLLDLVKMIHGAKDRVPDQSDMDELLKVKDMYSLLTISSWRNIGLEDPDFGAGRPARLMSYPRGMTLLPICTACMPCKDEYNVLSICVKEVHAGAFLQELSDMHLNYIQ